MSIPNGFCPKHGIEIYDYCILCQKEVEERESSQEAREMASEAGMSQKDFDRQQTGAPQEETSEEIEAWIRAAAREKFTHAGREQYGYEIGALAMYQRDQEQIKELSTTNEVLRLDRIYIRQKWEHCQEKLQEITNDRDVYKQWYTELLQKVEKAAATFPQPLQDWIKENNPYPNHMLSSPWTEGATNRAEADAIMIKALMEQLERAQGEKDEWRTACQNFVDKVERGEARSKRTYGEMKALMDKYSKK